MLRKKYEKYGAYEWVSYIENTSDKNTGVLTELYDCDITLSIAHEEPKQSQAYIPSVEKATKIYAPNGSTCESKEFYCNVDEMVDNRRKYHIYPGETHSYSIAGGRSSDKKAPFFNIDKNASYNITDAGGGTHTIDGTTLIDGLQISIPKRTAKILFYNKTSK